jgi:antitoxin component YwqK of YwqJK toxin-antitoxin module
MIAFKKYLFFLCFVTIFLDSAAQEIEIHYYPNGAIKSKGEMKNGIKSGCWLFYYPDGGLSAEEHYLKDELHGNVKYYDQSQNLIAIENWQFGYQQDSSLYFYPDGQKEKEGLFDDGLYSGRWMFYNPDGSLKKIGYYAEGLPNGTWKFYNIHGVLIQEGAFKNGMEEGEWKFYSDEGRLEFIGSFHEGKKIGKWFRANRKGKLKPLKYKNPTEPGF